VQDETPGNFEFMTIGKTTDTIYKKYKSSAFYPWFKPFLKHRSTKAKIRDEQTKNNVEIDRPEIKSFAAI